MFLLNKVIIFIIALFSFVCEANALVEPTNEFYVNDYANLLNYETEQYIIEKSKILNNTDGTQIVVVTVNNLEGMDIESYSLQLARKFGIGDKEKNNGLLLLLALEEREFRVEVGYGLEGILPDSKTGRFQDYYIIPYLKENKWNEGIKNGYDAFYTEIVKLNNLSLNYNEPIKQDDDVMKFYVPFLSITSMVIAPIIGNYKGKNKKTKGKNKKTKGKNKKTKEKNKIDYSNIFIILYLIIMSFMMYKYPYYMPLHVTCLFLGTMMYFIGYNTDNYSSGDVYYDDSSFSGRGGSSSRGGGGSFGGGGSSRRF